MMLSGRILLHTTICTWKDPEIPGLTLSQALHPSRLGAYGEKGLPCTSCSRTAGPGSRQLPVSQPAHPMEIYIQWKGRTEKQKMTMWCGTCYERRHSGEQLRQQEGQRGVQSQPDLGEAVEARGGGHKGFLAQLQGSV